MLISCGKENIDVPERKKNLLPEKAVTNTITKIQADSIVSQIPVSIEINGNNNTFKIKLRSGQEVIIPLSKNEERLSNAYFYSASDLISVEHLYGSYIEGPRIGLMVENDRFQSEWVINPTIYFNSFYVKYSLMGVTRWISGRMANWRGYVNYTMFYNTTYLRGGQIPWSGALAF